MSYTVTEKWLTPNKWSRPGRKDEMIPFEWIAVHWEAVVNGSALGVWKFFEDRKYGNNKYGSAREICDVDGNYIKCIPDDEMDYSVGSRTYTKYKYEMMGGTYPNSCVYSIEFPTIDMRGNYSDIVYNSMLDRVTDLLIEFNLDYDRVTTHGILTGKDCAKLYCPDYNVVDWEEWNKFKEDIKQLYLKKTKGEDMKYTKGKMNIELMGKYMPECDVIYEDGKTYIELRETFEKRGFDVDWSEEKTVIDFSRK